MKLSDTVLIVLSSAAGRDDRLVPRRTSVPPVADVNACRALVKQGLVEVVRAPPGVADIVTVREDDSPMAFVIADAGFRALNLEPPGSTATTASEAATVAHTGEDDGAAHSAIPAGAAATDTATAPQAVDDGVGANDAVAAGDVATDAFTGPGTAAHTASIDDSGAATEAAQLAPVAAHDAAPARTTLRQAAAAVLTAWDDEANRGTDIITTLEAPIATLRSLLAARAPQPATDAPRKPREGTKQQAVLTMLRRAEGTTVAQVTEATGWASHTVRGFFAGLKKKGIPVEAKERVTQVGPDKQGAKGSYTIYHVTTAD